MRRMRRWWIVPVLFCTFLNTAPAHSTVPVVATIFPIADIVRQIGRDDVEVVTLLPAGASPHTFEPSPAQIRDVAHARVFVQIGAGLDDWGAKLLAARTEAATVVRLSDGVLLANGDPHIWLDPVLMRDHAVPKILQALSAADVAHRSEFEHAAAELQSGLTRLDAEIRQAVAATAHKNYIAFHSAWRYFGERYGLQEIAVIEAFPGKEPSAREIAAVVEAARAAHVHAILIEPQFNPRVAQQVAHEIGGQTLTVDPSGGPDVPGRNSYINLMQYNLQVFVKVLQ
jgi:zinc transport system substrate-binding protein